MTIGCSGTNKPSVGVFEIAPKHIQVSKQFKHSTFTMAQQQQQQPWDLSTSPSLWQRLFQQPKLWKCWKVPNAIKHCRSDDSQLDDTSEADSSSSSSFGSSLDDKSNNNNHYINNSRSLMSARPPLPTYRPILSTSSSIPPPPPPPPQKPPVLNGQRRRVSTVSNASTASRHRRGSPIVPKHLQDVYQNVVTTSTTTAASLVQQQQPPLFILDALSIQRRVSALGYGDDDDFFDLSSSDGECNRDDDDDHPYYTTRTTEPQQQAWMQEWAQCSTHSVLRDNPTTTPSTTTVHQSLDNDKVVVHTSPSTTSSRSYLPHTPVPALASTDATLTLGWASVYQQSHTNTTDPQQQQTAAQRYYLQIVTTDDDCQLIASNDQHSRILLSQKEPRHPNDDACCQTTVWMPLQFVSESVGHCVPLGQNGWILVPDRDHNNEATAPVQQHEAALHLQFVVSLYWR